MDKVRENLKKLSSFRGDVPRKEMIQYLPDVKKGETFWVEKDNAPYVVTHANKKRVTVQPIGKDAQISTGMTVYELNKHLVAEEPVIDMSDTEQVNSLIITLTNFFAKFPDKYFLAYSQEIHSVSLFIRKQQKELYVSDVLETLSAIGELISIDPTDNGALEIWVRREHNPAVLLYLMPYDRGIVEV